MKTVYIPFNMIVDIDSGLIRLIEKTQNIPEYSINRLKSFLLKRININPIQEYNKIRNIDVLESAYDVILDKYYESILPLSLLTDMIAFVLNTYKLGLTNELRITVGCNYECEMEYMKKISSSIEYSIETVLNEQVDLNTFDYIFIKHLDGYYVDYLMNVVKIKAKRLYVADYNFNKIYENDEYMIDPELHLILSTTGNILSTVSVYNKKPSGGK